MVLERENGELRRENAALHELLAALAHLFPTISEVVHSVDHAPPGASVARLFPNIKYVPVERQDAQHREVLL
jgi:hypothetical protein